MLSYFQVAKKVILHLCPRGWISRFKKFHDLKICTRPTCRGILCDVIRKQNIFQTEVFVSNLQTCKYTLFLEVCKVEKILPVGTRLDISLKKSTTTFKFAHGLPVAVFYAIVFAKKIFSNRKYFFSNLQTSKKNGVFRSL